MTGKDVALGKGFNRLVLGLFLTGVVVSTTSWARDLTEAENLYKRTDYEQSLALLDKGSQDPATDFLLARNYFMQGEFKKATDYLLKVTLARPNNSEYWDWLGKAWGRRAETSNPLMAPSYATRARDAFEKSVALDGANRDALSDLFDYYLEAPGFLGGGYDKAMDIAERTSKVDPGEAYFEQAKLAQKRKEYEEAEIHFRKAISVAPHSVGRLISLARFLAMQGRFKESDAIFEQAKKVAPNEPNLWYAQADVLIKGKRNLPEARSLLQKYMTASLTTDDPPKTEAMKLLREAGGA